MMNLNQSCYDASLLHDLFCLNSYYFNKKRFYSTNYLKLDNKDLVLRSGTLETGSLKEVKPKLIYDDADKNKALILSQAKGLTGIYRWVNVTNNKSYVGSAINLKERFTNYFNINHLTGNPSMSICRALLKYGYSGFRLEILEYCNPKDRFERENHYINLLNPEYNILKVSTSMPSRSGIIVSEETKLKRGLNNPHRLLISVTDTLTGTETIYNSYNLAAKVIGVHSGQITQYFSKNQVKPFLKRYILKKIENTHLDLDRSIQKDKIVESWRAGIELEVLDLKTNATTLYPSVREAARILGLSHSTIIKYEKLAQPYSGQYIFRKTEILS